MKRSSRFVHVSVSRFVHHWVPGEGSIRLSDLDEAEEENETQQQAVRDQRRCTIGDQQQNLRHAWRGGKRMGDWFYQHILTPAFTYTILKPLEWTIKFAATSANTSRRLASRREREGEIRLD